MNDKIQLTKRQRRLLLVSKKEALDVNKAGDDFQVLTRLGLVKEDGRISGSV